MDDGVSVRLRLLSAMRRPTLLSIAVACVLVALTCIVFNVAVQSVPWASLTRENQAAGCGWNATNSSTMTWSNHVDRRPARRMFVMQGGADRLGNHMFAHASLLGIARCTGYRPVLVERSPTRRLLLAAFTLTNNTGFVKRRNIRRANRWLNPEHAKFRAPENMQKFSCMY